MSRVCQFGIPGLGRVAFSKDQGEANLFSQFFLHTRLKAALYSPEKEVLEQYDFGSGLVTNVGVLALAQDWNANAKAKESFNLFPNLKWHAWGTGSTAATVKDIKLGEFQESSTGSNKATEGTNSTSANGEGAPIFLSTAKLKAGGTFEIKEWGLFTAQTISATTGTPLVSVTATEGKATGTSLTASSTEAKGERLKILVPTEATEIWGLITGNTTSVVTVPAWYKQSTGAVQAPVGTSPFTIRPVMFDHRTFTPINVESGNEVEFVYELQILSGG